MVWPRSRWGIIRRRAMHDVALLATLAGGLTAALALGYITQRLGLSPIVGYLLAGVAGRPVHAGLRRRHASRRPARRGRRHPADVRRRPAVPPRGAARRAPRRRSRRGRPERWSPRGLGAAGRARCSAGRWPAAIVFGLALSVASTVVLDPRAGRQPATCTRRRATSPSAGSSSRTCSRSRAGAAAGARPAPARRSSIARPGHRRSRWLKVAGAGGVHLRRRRRASSRGCSIGSPRRGRASCSR